MTNYFLKHHNINSLDVGDSIKFRAPTRHSNATVWRKVTGFYGSDYKPTVRYEGIGNFIVNHIEISEVEKAS